MKHNCRFTLFLAILCASVGLLTGCHGICDWIYDDPEEDLLDPSLPDGWKELSDDGLSGTLYLDASSYTRWNYVDWLNTRCTPLDFGTDITPDSLAAIEPVAWDFAVHRYDVKTHGGRAAETRYTSIDELLSDCRSANTIGEWLSTQDIQLEPDVWCDSVVTIDMSHMLDGYLVYLPSFYNRQISHWLDVNTSQMPPIYTKSDRIYVLVTGDGRAYALWLKNYISSGGVKGFMTIGYRYLGFLVEPLR